MAKNRRTKKRLAVALACGIVTLAPIAVGENASAGPLVPKLPNQERYICAPTDTDLTRGYEPRTYVGTETIDLNENPKGFEARAIGACRIARRMACQPVADNEGKEPAPNSQFRICWWDAFGTVTLVGMRSIARTMPKALACPLDGKCAGAAWIRPGPIVIIAIFMFGLSMAVRQVIGLLGRSQVGDEPGRFWQRGVQLMMVLAGVTIVTVPLNETLWELTGAILTFGGGIGLQIMSEFDPGLASRDVPPIAGLEGMWTFVGDTMSRYSLAVAGIAGRLIGIAWTLIPFDVVTGSGAQGVVSGLTSSIRNAVSGQLAEELGNQMLSLLLVTGAFAIAMAGIMMIVTYAMTMAEALLHVALAVGLAPVFVLGHLAPKWCPSLVNMVRMVGHGGVLLAAGGLCVAVATLIVDTGFNQFVKLTADVTELKPHGCGEVMNVAKGKTEDSPYGASFRAYIDLLTCPLESRLTGDGPALGTGTAEKLHGVIIMVMLAYAASAVLQFAGVIASEMTSAGIQTGKAGQQAAQKVQSGIGMAKSMVTKQMMKFGG